LDCLLLFYNRNFITFPHILLFFPFRTCTNTGRSLIKHKQVFTLTKICSYEWVRRILIGDNLLINVNLLEEQAVMVTYGYIYIFWHFLHILRLITLFQIMRVIYILLVDLDTLFQLDLKRRIRPKQFVGMDVQQCIYNLNRWGDVFAIQTSNKHLFVYLRSHKNTFVLGPSWP
jgi:hypothetical protein